MTVPDGGTPAEAVAAANNAAELWRRRTLMGPKELGYHQAMINAALAAAAPHITARRFGPSDIRLAIEAARATGRQEERERWLAADDGTRNVYDLGRYDERQRCIEVIRNEAAEGDTWTERLADLLAATPGNDTP